LLSLPARTERYRPVFENRPCFYLTRAFSISSSWLCTASMRCAGSLTAAMPTLATGFRPSPSPPRGHLRLCALMRLVPRLTALLSVLLLRFCANGFGNFPLCRRWRYLVLQGFGVTF